MKPVDRPCLPPELVRRATEAEKRRDQALDRLLRKLHPLPMGDPFEAGMRALIDADATVINLRKDR